MPTDNVITNSKMEMCIWNQGVLSDLMSIVTRLLIPKEILSDRGSSFFSSVIREIYRFLGISLTAVQQPSDTSQIGGRDVPLNSPRYGQEDDCRQVWVGQCYLFLFIVCLLRAPCPTTGFSLFELIFRKKVRGPLDVLCQEWMAIVTTTHFAMDWLLQLREDLEEMWIEATEKHEIQLRTKRWFDKTSTISDFQIGDEVLVFMPDMSSSKKEKLDDVWAGP